MMHEVTTQTAEEFWQGIYGRASSKTWGKPTQIPETLVKDRPTGQNVRKRLGVEFAAAAIRVALQNASRNGVDDRARF